MKLVGWLATFSKKTLVSTIGSIRFTIGFTSSSHLITNFKHPVLTSEEMLSGTRLGFDSWADTSCAGRHAFVESFVEGKSVNAVGFSTSLGTLSNLPIANVLYAYDTAQGNTLIIENCNAIYLGEKMDDSLVNPVQCECNDTRVDLRPKMFYPDVHACQTITFSDGTSIPLELDGVLPCLYVRRPTQEEIDSCPRVQLTSEDEWDPREFNGIMSMSAQSIKPVRTNDDPLTCELLEYSIASVLAAQPLLAYNDDSGYYSISPLATKSKASLTPEQLSRLWHIGISTASRTLKATTHKCLRSTGMLARRYKTDKSQLRYKQMTRQFGTFYCDYLKVSTKSIRGNIGGTVYTNKLGFKRFYPHSDETGQSTAHGLRTFIDLVGLPASLHSDGHSNFTEGAFKRLLRKFGILHTTTEPHSPWQNRAEYAIGEIKQYSRRLMQKTNTPIRLWCFCYEYSAEILSLCATGRYDLHGRTPYELVLNYTPDISELVTFTWFQWCYYLCEHTKTKVLCRWLGPSHGIGQAFCSYLLTDKATFIARSSVIPVPDEELNTDIVRQNCVNFMASVEQKIGNHKDPLFVHDKPDLIYYEPFGDTPIEDETILPYGDEIETAKTLNIDEEYLESLDEFIGANVVIPGSTPGIEPVIAVIKGRKRDHDGNVIGRANANPILDSRIYELQFPDGRVEDYAMNVIIENLMAQTDANGIDIGIFQEIVDVRTDKDIAVQKGEAAYTTFNGRKKPVVTTKGWELLIRWNDGSTSWLPLGTVKESLPVQLAEFAFAKDIHNEPAFKWWVFKTLKKRDYLIKKISTRHPMHKGNMKFGIQVPRNVDEALELDRKNGNSFWQRS